MLLFTIARLPAQKPPLDSVSLALLNQVKSEATKNNAANIVKLFRDNLETVRYGNQFFHEAITFLLQTGQFETAGKVLGYNPFLMSQHNQLGLYLLLLFGGDSDVG